MTQTLRCRPCKEDGAVLIFTQRNDESGVAAMREHLQREHGIGAEQVDVPVIKIPPAIRLDRP